MRFSGVYTISYLKFIQILLFVLPVAVPHTLVQKTFFIRQHNNYGRIGNNNRFNALCFRCHCNFFDENIPIPYAQKIFYFINIKNVFLKSLLFVDKIIWIFQYKERLCNFLSPSRCWKVSRNIHKALCTREDCRNNSKTACHESLNSRIS